VLGEKGIIWGRSDGTRGKNGRVWVSKREDERLAWGTWQKIGQKELKPGEEARNISGILGKKKMWEGGGGNTS